MIFHGKWAEREAYLNRVFSQVHCWDANDWRRFDFFNELWRRIGYVRQ